MFGLFQNPETKARNMLREGNYGDAFKLLQQLAVKGKPRAMSALGMMYANGQGVARDFKIAHKWFKRAADIGLQEAQIFIGKMYENGDGVEIDLEEARYWFELAASPCDVFSESGSFNHEDGSPIAKCHLGNMYALGVGVEKDQIRGIKLYEEAANAGEEMGQFSLGYSYDNGLGVEKDAAKAARWYKLAALQGHLVAQNNLGVLYWEGSGVPQDRVLAHMWFNLAAAQGQKNAIENRSDISEEMSPLEISKAQEMARNRPD